MVVDIEVQVSLHDGFAVATDPSRLDLVAVHGWLSSGTYRATGRSLDAVSLKHRVSDACHASLVRDSGGRADPRRSAVHAMLKGLRSSSDQGSVTGSGCAGLPRAPPASLPTLARVPLP